MENKYVGKICPYCKTPFKQDDTIVVCKSCQMPHHLSCWQANEGCTTYGCNGLIDFIINQENATKQAAVKVDTSPAQGIAETASSNPGKFESIFETTECKLQDNVPVLIEKATLIKNSADESIFARCTFRSLTDKPIKALLLDIVASDVWGNAAEGVEGFQLLDLKTKREAEFGQTTAIPIPNKNVRSIDVVIKKILYEDRSMEDCAETYTTVPMQISLLTALGMKEAVDHFSEKTTKIAKFVPAVGKQVWRCTCGATNVAGEDICYNCKTSLIAQQSAYQPEQIIDETKALLEEKRRKEEELRLAREKEQREAEERLRKAQEEKERQEREEKEAKKAKRKKRIKRIVFAFVAVVLLAGAVYGTGWHLIPLIRYNLAASCVEKQEFDSAYNTYVALGDYKDSAEKAIDTLYQKASYLEGQELFVEAATEYERIPSYQDSQTKATYCRNEANYREAKSKFDSKDYAGALTAFTNLGGYSDSKDWVNKTNYEIAKGSFESGDYSKAFEQFNALGDYEDSKTQANESKYMMAEKAFDSKDYLTAYDYYNALKKYKDSEEKALKSQYLYATDCFDQKQYKEASDTFLSLRNSQYEDSAEKYIEASYLYAKSCYDSKNYAEAATYFSRAGDYEDSQSLLKDSKYENALKLIDSKEYTKAVNILDGLGNYKESKKKINEAKYAYVKAHKSNTDSTTYSYLKDLKAAGYSDSKKIYNDLYSWKVEITSINNSENGTTNYSSLKYYDKWYFHYKVSGGTPSGSEQIYYKMIWPDGSTNGKKKLNGTSSRGSTGWVNGYWSSYGSYYGLTGTCTLYFYDSSGNQIGKGSVTIN